jgi:hypothetical protein
VLEAGVGQSLYPNHGQRVVNASRVVHPASDLFLGWMIWQSRHFYVRQSDMKSVPSSRRSTAS